MAKSKAWRPELIILANSAQDIHQRFHGWPDLLVTDGRFAEVLQLPVHEQLPLTPWREQLRSLSAPNLEEMRAGVRRLQQAWKELPGDDWADVAHSLLVHFLLWGVGGRILLKHLQVSVGAAVVNQLDASDSIWPGFVRANQEFGVSCLLGGNYLEMPKLRDLLGNPDVAKSMATLRSDLTLLVNTSSASRILNRVSALASNQTADGAHQIVWPQLAADQLRLVQGELSSFSSSLSLLLRQTVLPLTQAATGEVPAYQPADLALVIFSLLVKLLADDWLGAGLLPQPTQALLDGLG